MLQRHSCAVIGSINFVSVCMHGFVVVQQTFPGCKTSYVSFLHPFAGKNHCDITNALYPVITWKSLSILTMWIIPLLPTDSCSGLPTKFDEFLSNLWKSCCNVYQNLPFCEKLSFARLNVLLHSIERVVQPFKDVFFVCNKFLYFDCQWQI